MSRRGSGPSAPVDGGRLRAPAARPVWRGLRTKLFLSYLAVVAVGLVTVLLAIDLVAPALFASHVARMMGSGIDAVHGTGTSGGSTEGMLDAQRAAAGQDEALTTAFRNALSGALLVAGAAATTAALLVGLFVADRVVAPVQRLALATRRIAAGHFAERVPDATDDELGDLAAHFNEMASALETTERRRLELIGDVAHELRTPVATLQGYLEGLLDGVVPAEPATWAMLYDENGRLRRLIDDLQELSRAEARQFSLRVQPSAPGTLIQTARARLASDFAEKGVALTIDVPAGLPRVAADPDRVVQVLTNLLTNALRATPAPGQVRVSVRTSGGAVEFVVADSGAGIAAEHLPRLFERFYRVDKSRSRAMGGSGIGLTIARELVEAMGGRIQAASEGLGRGATFSLTLPVAAPAH